MLEEGIKVIIGGYLLEFLDEEFVFMVKNLGIFYSNFMIEKVLVKGILVLIEVELVYLIFEVLIVGIIGLNGKIIIMIMIGEVLIAVG